MRKTLGIILALVGLGVVVVAFVLWRARQSSEPQGPTVAYSQNLRGASEKRNGDDETWGPLAEGEALHAGQSIRTTETSRLVLAMRGAGSFVVGPETELEITRVDLDEAGKVETIAVRLERGVVRFDAAANPHSHVELEIGDFTVGTDEGGRLLARAGPGPEDYSVSFLDASGFVFAQGGDRTPVDKDRGVRIAASRLQASEALPEPPVPSSGEEEIRVYTADAASALARFNFKKKDAVIRLVIARDPLMTDVVATIEGSGALESPKLPPGTYFWVASQVSESGLSGKTTETRKIEVLSGPAPAGADEAPSVPIVVHPSRSASIFYASHVPTVGVDWPGETTNLRYRFRLSRNRGHRSPQVDDLLSESRYSASRLAPGRYFWRVDDSQGKVHEGRFLVAQATRVRAKKKVVSVSERYVKSNVVFQQEPPNLSFEWKADDRAEGGYRLVVTRGKNATRQVLVRKTTGTQLRLAASKLGEGTFNWRVERLLADGSVFYPGKSRQLIIRFDNDTPSVDIREPLDGATITGADVRVEGIAPAGTQIFANGTKIPLNSSGRFSATVKVSPRNPRVVFRTERGAHTAYYVRRLRFVAQASGGTTD